MTTQSPIRFSIIIPHYNIPKLLQRCLDSIPQRPDLEVIVVDDNSDPEIVDFDHFPGSDRSDVKLILDKKGGGGGYARNLGLDMAKGKWILFSDADDFLSTEVGSILDEAVNSPADILYFNIKSVLSEDVSRESIRALPKERMFVNYEKTRDDTIFRLHYPEPWGKIISHSLIDRYNIRFDEVSVSNDYFFSTQIGCLARSVEVVNRTLCVITLREGSVCYKFGDSEEKLLTRLHVAQRVQVFAHKHGYKLTPMPCRCQMVLLLKHYPLTFIRELIHTPKEISKFTLVWQIFCPKYWNSHEQEESI